MFKITTSFAPKAAIFAAAACTLGLFAAPAAFAETTNLTRSVEVSYKDLDLGTAEGQKALDKRIAAAARKVCRSDRMVTGSNLQGGIENTCYRQALSAVRTHVEMAVSRADDNRLGG